MLQRIDNFFENLFSLTNNRQVVAIYRLSHFLHKKGVPLFPFTLQILNYYLHSIEIHYEARIGKRFQVVHSTGIVIGRGAVIGDDVAVYSGVVIGVSHSGAGDGPVICDNVKLYTHAKVLGAVRVGVNAVVGAGSVVIKDVPDNSVVAGVPAKIIRV